MLGLPLQWMGQFIFQQKVQDCELEQVRIFGKLNLVNSLKIIL
jgi:hypothetical protein